MALPSLASLEALEAIARAGSVTRAASTLHLTQSAISHRVRGLERDTGLQLLEHVGRGVRLTAAGLRLARAATEARQLLEDTVASLAREPGREVLSISCSPSFAIRFLVPRLAKFHAAHPELDLRVAADQGTIDPLRAGADALVVLRAGPAPGAFSEKLCEELVFPVVSPRLLERGPALRTAADLRRHTLLHDEALAEAPERVGWQSWLASAGEPLLRAPSIRFSHAYLAIEAALVGDGVALARRSLVAEDLARGRLVAPLEPSVPSGLAYWLITAQDPARRAPLTALRAFLRSSLRDAQRLADRARARRKKKIGITGRREAGKARGEI